MRIKTTTNLTITYPERIVFLYDNNCIQIESSSGTVGADITISHVGKTASLSYVSKFNKLVFSLYDTLQYLSDDNLSNYNFTVQTYIDGFPDEIFSFSVQVLKGRSFRDRSHSTDRTIYLYNEDELTKVQIYSPADSVLSIDGRFFNLTTGYNAVNLDFLEPESTYTACLTQAVSQPTISVPFVTVKSTNATARFSYTTGEAGDPVHGGDIWYQGNVFPVCLTFEYVGHCDNFNFCELRYRDCDGMTRFIAGKLLEETISTKHSDYYSTNIEIFKESPKSLLTSKNKSIKVGFESIANNAYVSDILMSEEVFMRNYNGDWIPVTIKTESLTNKNEELIDFVLEINICK